MHDDFIDETAPRHRARTQFVKCFSKSRDCCSHSCSGASCFGEMRAAATHEKLRHAQDLLRHRIPDGDLSQVFDLALAALVERLEKQKLAATDRPRASRGAAPGSRRIPAEVKRAVWKRDGARRICRARRGRRVGGRGAVAPIAVAGCRRLDGWLRSGPAI